ncbi:MAG: hypothetical protein LBV45_08610, partial [Xanthomonadaceae bacterium]|nr:hypothetical protein [Xanthomonadaceae bacterium]
RGGFGYSGEHRYERKIAFQIWSRDGQRLLQSEDAPVLAHAPTVSGFSVLRDRNRHDWRVFVMEDHRSDIWVWVGERDDARRKLIGRIVLHILIPMLCGIALLAGVVWWAVGWGVKPLHHMTRIIAQRRPDDLQPLEIAPLPDELAPMQVALNRLLGQINDVLSRERRFIADAAHELRTPLAVLRIHAQNALAGHDEAERDRALQFLVQGVDRCTRLVSQLLILARMEPLEHAPPSDIADLVPLIRQELADLLPLAAARDIELELDAATADYRVPLHAGAIGILLQNLVTNAINFSSAGDVIRVTLRRDAEAVRLGVEDNGPGIDDAVRERLFERFFSQGEHHGAGLGLAIVAAVAARHGARIDLRNRPQGGLCATVEFPLPK